MTDDDVKIAAEREGIFAPKRMTKAEWLAKGRELFGDDVMKWRFKCPLCGHIASTQDWKDAGATSGEVGFSCIGRHIPGSRSAFNGEGPGPCDYTGGGLFPLNPIIVEEEDGREIAVFDFALLDEIAEENGDDLRAWLAYDPGKEGSIP